MRLRKARQERLRKLGVRGSVLGVKIKRKFLSHRMKGVDCIDNC